MDHQAVIVDTSQSTYARLKPVPLTSVKLTESFWLSRWRVNIEVTLPSQYQLLKDTGRLANFKRAAGQLEGDYVGMGFNDSDVYKWLEAASWALAVHEDTALRAMVDEAIAWIAQAQCADGYLNTYYTVAQPDARWSNLQDRHELYCAGHLFQAAVAHVRATRQTSLLDVAQRFADLICETFGPDAGQRQGVPGHPEIEMALVELARVTGEPRYLAQARYFLDVRGRGLIGGRAYHQDRVPFRELPRLEGHAVRALYLAAGATDMYAETGDAALGQALAHLWRHLATRQVYVSGGVGGRYVGEALGADYELPNARAYAETCAGIANVMWSWRMLQLRGDVRYADMLECALYNAVLPGIALDGASYFYRNPLRSDGQQRREPWFACACCPPNIARTLAALPGYIYSVSEETVWVHLYTANEARITLPDGREVALVQRTLYPWDGNITVDVLTAGTFTLKLRIPAWCADDVPVLLNGLPYEGEGMPGSYVTIRRRWKMGDAVCLRMAMLPRRIVSHPYVLENTGRLALMRGPLLYCLEAADHPPGDLRDIVLPENSGLEAMFEGDLLGGIFVLRGEAALVSPGRTWAGRLYRRAGSSVGERRSVNLLAIPYFAWANREAGQMQVWLRHDCEVP